MINTSFNVSTYANNEAIRIITLFLKEKKNEIEIAKITGFQADKIHRTLNNRKMINLIYKDKGEEIYNQIQEQLSHPSGFNMLPKPLRLDIFYKDQDLQMKFLAHLALTFRASRQTVEELFHVPAYMYSTDLVLNNINTFFRYLENIEMPNQVAVKKNIISFYNAYITAVKNKDKERIVELIRTVTDYKIKELMAHHEKRSEYSDYDIKTILDYQLKYSMPVHQVENVVGIKHETYNKRVQELLVKMNNEEYQDRVNKLYDFYQLHKERYIRNA